MIIPMNLELHIADNVTEEQRAKILDAANDREALGVDDLAEPITDLADAMAELIMFDPEWLMHSRVVHGWTVVPVADA
jgi:hypothetical protein